MYNFKWLYTSSFLKSYWYKLTILLAFLFRVSLDINRRLVNDNASNSDHLGMSLPRIIYLLSFSHMVASLVANVYVNNCVEWLLQG